MDMLVNLQTLPKPKDAEGIRIVRSLAPNSEEVLRFVETNFDEGWKCECQTALCQQPSTCFIAVRGETVVGFACYDATAKGFFGPIGVAATERGKGTGASLLVHTLTAMREAGYGYAVIGWCDHAANFYRKTVGAVEIPGSEPQISVYGRLIKLPDDDEE